MAYTGARSLGDRNLLSTPTRDALLVFLTTLTISGQMWRTSTDRFRTKPGLMVVIACTFSTRGDGSARERLRR